jgi:hypothetical protein
VKITVTDLLDLIADLILRTYGRDLLGEEWIQIVDDFSCCHEAELNKAEDLENLKK